MTGRSAAGKAELAARWRSDALADAPVAVIFNETGASLAPDRARLGGIHAVGGRARRARPQAPASADETPQPWLESFSACLCCTGPAAMSAVLSRLLRRGPWAHLLIVLHAAARPTQFIDLLRAASLERALRLTGVALVIDAASPEPGGGPLAMLDLECAATADAVWLRTAGADERAVASAASALQRLRSDAVGPFDQPLALIQSEVPPGPIGGWVSARPGLELGADRTWRWSAPAEVRFDRAAVQRVLAQAAASGLFHRVAAVFRTERDWYAWQFEAGQTSRIEGCPSLYRSANRLQWMFAPDTQSADEGLERARLAPWVQAIQACRIGGS